MQKQTKSALNKFFAIESYRNWRKSINILKNNGLFLKNKQKILKKENNGLNFYWLETSRPPIQTLIHNLTAVHEGTRGTPNEPLFPRQVAIQLPKLN